MSEAAVAIPLIVVALGFVTSLAMTIRNVRRGRTPAELLGHASLFVIVTSVFQAASVLGALAIITVTNDRPIPIIDRIRWLPATGLSVLAWACWAVAAMALIRQHLNTSSEQRTQLRRPWFVLVLIACLVVALQWIQGKIGEIVAEERHAIYYEDSQIAFRAVTEPEPVNALRSRDARHIELTNYNGELTGVAIDMRGMAFRWNARAWDSEPSLPILPPRVLNSAFAMDGYICGIESSARASCSKTDFASGIPSGEFVADGRASVFLPAPICNAQLRMCALIDNGTARCFAQSAAGEFREQPLPLGNGIRAMTPAFGCIGCFVEKNGRVRCLMQGLGGEVISNDVEGIADAVAIASSLEHACAIERDGRLFCWDLETKARLAHENMPWKSKRIPDIRASQVSVAQTHACALDESGKVYCWGSNRWGELCDGSRIDRESPVQAIGVSDAVMVSVESSVTCIARRKGEVACCGVQRRRW